MKFLKKNRTFIFVFTIGLLVLSSNIWGFSIYILDEAKNSTCAREMLDRSDFIVPTFNGELRTDKPPLHYFFMMMAYSVFGVNEFAARFFSVVAGLMTLLITFVYTQKFFDKETALWSMGVLICSIHFTLEFHLAVPDPYLIFCIALSLFSFYDFYRNRKVLQLYLFYISLAMGVLAKGPVALALPGLIVVLFLALSKNLRFFSIKDFKPLRGVLLFSVIALPWYVLVSLKTNFEWLKGFFLKHNVERFTGSMEGHGGLFLLTFVFVVAGLLPFSVFIFRAFQFSWKQRKENDFHLFVLLTSMVFIVFFSVSGTKLPNYTMPVYPFIAISIGVLLKHVQYKNLSIYFIASILAGLVLVGAVYAGFYFDKDLYSLKNFSFLLLIIPILASIAYYFSWFKQNIKAFFILGAGWIMANLIIFYVVIPQIDSINPVYKTLKKTDLKNVAYYKDFNHSFAFYSMKVIPRLDSISDVNAFFKENEDAVLLTAKRFKDELKDIENARIILESKDLFEKPTSLVYSNHPR